jgi:hypothetical protein
LCLVWLAADSGFWRPPLCVFSFLANCAFYPLFATKTIACPQAKPDSGQNWMSHVGKGVFERGGQVLCVGSCFGWWREALEKPMIEKRRKMPQKSALAPPTHPLHHDFSPQLIQPLKARLWRRVPHLNRGECAVCAPLGLSLMLVVKRGPSTSTLTHLAFFSGTQAQAARSGAVFRAPQEC